MAKSQIKFGLRDRQIFSRAKKPCKQWKKDLNNLPMAFDTRLWHERKITCPEQDSGLRLPVTSGVWYPLHHWVNHTGYMATYRCVEIESSQSTGHFSFETFVCIMAKSQIKFGLRDRQIFSRAKKPCKHWEKDVNNLPKAFDTRLVCGSCSHCLSRSPKLPLVFLWLDKNKVHVFYFLNVALH